jgi:double-stranded uracil-DNA glycosylase
VNKHTPRLRPPTADAIRASAGCRIPDLIAPDLSILFCGINPGLYSAATKYHFARPGNRFWPALHLAGFTPRVFAPNESHGLLELGYGITSLVQRATATAREVTSSELVASRRRLRRTVSAYHPHWVAVLGVGAYRIAFGEPRAEVGPQQNALGRTRIWLLPSPSGANGSYPLVDFVKKLREFYAAVDQAERV